MSLRPPSGTPAPTAVTIAGLRVDLVAAARRVCERYYEEYPDERDRYGAAGGDWCRHDNQWLLSWAVDDVLGAADLDQQVRWLARVLGARDFPLSRLVRNRQIAAGLVGEGSFGDAGPAVAGRLAAATETVAGLDLGGAAAAGDRPV